MDRHTREQFHANLAESYRTLTPTMQALADEISAQDILRAAGVDSLVDYIAGGLCFDRLLRRGLDNIAFNAIPAIRAALATGELLAP